LQRGVIQQDILPPLQAVGGAAVGGGAAVRCRIQHRQHLPQQRRRDVLQDT